MNNGKLTNQECAWLAATIDCEGAISICKFSKRGASYMAMVRVNMTSLTYIDHIDSTYPGYRFAQQQENRQKLYIWELYGWKCRDFLLQVKHLLVIKQAQAELCLNFLDFQKRWYHRGKKYPALVASKFERIQQQMKKLNKPEEIKEKLERTK